MHTNMDEVGAYLKAAKDVLDILKTFRGLLPKGPKAEEVERRLVDAERALRASEAQLAKALGYKLCQCTFPPQIMLSKGHHKVHGVEIFKCEACNKQEPSEHRLAQFDDANAENERLAQSTHGWMR